MLKLRERPRLAHADRLAEVQHGSDGYRRRSEVVWRQLLLYQLLAPVLLVDELVELVWSQLVKCILVQALNVKPNGRVQVVDHALSIDLRQESVNFLQLRILQLPFTKTFVRALPEVLSERGVDKVREPIRGPMFAVMMKQVAQVEVPVLLTAPSLVEPALEDLLEIVCSFHVGLVHQHLSVY